MAAPLHRRYRRELIAVVVLKLALLLAARQLWFSQPLAPHMRAPAERVEAQLFSPTPSKDVHDDSR